MGALPAITHSTCTGHFRCDCGAKLVFNIEARGVFRKLENRSEDRGGIRGDCPKCGRTHIRPGGRAECRPWRVRSS